MNLAIAKQLANEPRGAGLQGRADARATTRRSTSRSAPRSPSPRTATSSSRSTPTPLAAAATRGIEIYTLDANHERHSLDVAARENGVPALASIRSSARWRGSRPARSRRTPSGSPDSCRRASSRGAKQNDASLPDLGRQEGTFLRALHVEHVVGARRDRLPDEQARCQAARNGPYQTLLAEQIADGVDRYRDADGGGRSGSPRIASGGLRAPGRSLRIGGGR